MKREIEIRLTPHELAAEFAEMSAANQVDFLVAVELIFRTWGPHRRDTQIMHIGDELRAAQGAAKAIVESLAGELAKPVGAPEEIPDEGNGFHEVGPRW